MRRLRSDISHFNSRWGILTLIALVTNNISMVSGCQSPSRSSAVVLDMRAVHRSPQNPRLSALARLSTQKDTILPLYFHLTTRSPQGVLSRVTGITGLSAPEWQQIGLWTPLPQPAGR